MHPSTYNEHQQLTESFLAKLTAICEGERILLITAAKEPVVRTLAAG